MTGRSKPERTLEDERTSSLTDPMKNPNGPSIEQVDDWNDELADQEANMSGKPSIVEVGNEEWSYVVEGNYTYVYNADGEKAVCLRWAVDDPREIQACAYGWGAGIRAGTEAGRIQKEREIKKVLGLL